MMVVNKGKNRLLAQSQTRSLQYLKLGRTEGRGWKLHSKKEVSTSGSVDNRKEFAPLEVDWTPVE